MFGKRVSTNGNTFLAFAAVTWLIDCTGTNPSRVRCKPELSSEAGRDVEWNATSTADVRPHSLGARGVRQEGQSE